MSADESLIAYCGLYCGDCPLSSGEIAEGSGALLAKLDRWSVDRSARGFAAQAPEFAPLEQFPVCRSCLEALERLRCPGPCRAGGGTTVCPIRACCKEKGLAGCWVCVDLETCRTLDFLRPVNGSAHLKNLRILKSRGLPAFLSGEKLWYLDPKEPDAWS
jgi:hypothetical protein